PAYAELAKLVADALHEAALAQRDDGQPDAGDQDAAREAAEGYARLWTSLSEHGEEVPQHQLEAARQELGGTGWGLVQDGDGWRVVRTGAPPPGRRYEPEVIEGQDGALHTVGWR